MKKIDIRINKARILSYSVELNEDSPEVCATIGLFSDDRKISTFSLRTQSYYADSIQFVLPFEMISPIKELAQQLEHLVVKEMNKDFLQLEAPK